MERKFYHILSSGEVKEISGDEWLKMSSEDRYRNNTRLFASVLDNEINLNKGLNHLFLKKEWLDKIFVPGDSEGVKPK